MRRNTIFWCTFLIVVVIEKCIAVPPAHAPTSVREVSHEDIRDAIMSLVNIFRDNTDKLERHEARERQLGEQLKKSFSLIEKKQKAEETSSASVLEALNSINRRLEAIENIVLKIDDNKFAKHSSEGVQNEIHQKLSNLEQSVQKNEATLHKLTVNIEQKLDVMVGNLQQIQSMTSIGQQLTTPSNSQPNDYVAKLNEKLADVRLQLENLNIKLELQTSASQETVQILKNIENNRQIADVKLLTNITQEKLEILKYIVESEVTKLHEKIGISQELLMQKEDNIFSAITNSVNTNEVLRGNMADSYDQLRAEIKSLAKIDQVLLQTADNVLDTKRRVEYGTHQILLEVGDLVKSLAKDTSDAIDKRFYATTAEILENQNNAMKNLSTKIETEISQVWRQIGIMYQILTNSADSLSKLQQQTDIYVNGSLSSLDSMDGRVGQITSRMSEVDEHLNYLLGRLSLVTQEFNQIKLGLGEALDNIRNSFHTVQDKMKETGPGPHPIEDVVSGYSGQIQKTKYNTD